MTTRDHTTLYGMPSPFDRSYGRWLLTVFFSLVSGYVLCQCPVANFELETTACLGEQLALESGATNAAEVEWYFCDTDYNTQPSFDKIVSGYGAVYYSKFIREGGDSYLFFVSQTQNKLIGLRFTDLTQLQYEVHCEIDLSGIITNPAGIEMEKEAGEWVGFVSSIVSPFKFVRIVFSGDLKSLTANEDLSSLLSLSTPFDVKVQFDGTNYFAFITNSTAATGNQLLRLSFGSSLFNVPQVSSIAFPASTQTASMAFHAACDEWVAYVSARNGKLFKVDFGADLGKALPTVTELTLSEAVNDPGGLLLVEDHDSLVLIVQSRNGYIYSGTMSSTADNTVDITPFGNVKATTRDWGLEALVVDGDVRIIASNFTNGGVGGLYSLKFPETCPASNNYSTQPANILSFSQTGTFKVTLEASNAQGVSNRMTREVTVSGLQAPVIAVTHPESFCAMSSVDFTAVSDQEISTYDWNFGDGAEPSTDPMPQHDYSNAGSFKVVLKVMASNGCSNFLESNVVIYNRPSADFSIPPAPLCTNNPLTFTNQTPDIYDGNLTYEWLVGDTPVTTERDLDYTFPDTGPKDITLRTTIPGCNSEITKTTEPLYAGPLVDFSFSGTCEDELFSFQHLLTDPFESLLWTLGNGQSSTDLNPTATFSDFGEYEVTLSATNAAGCENVKTTTVVVHSKPAPAFSVDGPPNTCTDVNTIFHNHTTNPDGTQIAEWLWDFGNTDDLSTSSDREPTHTYLTADTYAVSLTATSEEGCVSAVQEDVPISASPPAAYTHTPPCEDLPVQFSAEAGSDIIDWYWEIGTSYYRNPSPIHTFPVPGDYSVLLETESANGCRSASTTTVHVPEPVQPDFSYIKNCSGYETVLYDITSGTDPVASRYWDFGDGASSTTSPATNSFAATGTYDVALRVTTVTGCTYEVTKPINVVSPPIASFIAAPTAGAWPLEVAFENNSVGSTEYLWDFGHGGATSVDASPNHTFPGPETYTVTLTASNDQQCEDAYSAEITTVDPLPDVEIERLSLVPTNDGSLKLIVTLRNKGNTVLKELPLDFDFGGTLSLSEVVAEPITPGSQYNFVLSTGIVDAGTLPYLCVAADLEGDVAVDGNRRCSDLDKGFFALPPYPNPSSGMITLEWISQAAGTVRISIANALGQQEADYAIQAAEGLNQQVLHLEGLANGLYFITIGDGNTRTTQRIIVVDVP